MKITSAIYCFLIFLLACKKTDNNSNPNPLPEASAAYVGWYDVTEEIHQVSGGLHLFDTFMTHIKRQTADSIIIDEDRPTVTWGLHNKALKCFGDTLSAFNLVGKRYGNDSIVLIGQVYSAPWMYTVKQIWR